MRVWLPYLYPPLDASQHSLSSFLHMYMIGVLVGTMVSLSIRQLHRKPHKKLGIV